MKLLKIKTTRIDTIYLFSNNMGTLTKIYIDFILTALC